MMYQMNSILNDHPYSENTFWLWWKKVELKSTTPLQTKGPFYNHVRVWVMLIVEDPAATVKCRTALKVPFL